MKIFFLIWFMLTSFCVSAQNDSLVRKRKADSLIVSADSAFAAGNYLKAKKIYWQAHTLNPNHVYVAEKIKQCDEELAHICYMNRPYLAAIKTADSLFLLEEYRAARLKYKEALAALPTEYYPKDQIDRCDELLKED